MIRNKIELRLGSSWNGSPHCDGIISIMYLDLIQTACVMYAPNIPSSQHDVNIRAWN